MNDSILYGLSGLGLLVIVALSVYIVRQLGKLKEQRRQQEQNRQRLEEAKSKAREQREYMIESIRVIARAMSEDERLTLTEGCIRLKVLIDNLKPEIHQDPDFEIIEQHYQATRHIPFLKEWRKLERREQRRYQHEMNRLESQNRSALLRAAEKLRQYPLERMH